jgi:hypothetical protein
MLKKQILLILALLCAAYQTSAQAIYKDIKNYKVYYASAKRNTQDAGTTQI